MTAALPPYKLALSSCNAEAFCNYAQNPGCGGSATGGVVTFSNLRHAWGATAVVHAQLLKMVVTTREVTGV